MSLPPGDGPVPFIKINPEELSPRRKGDKPPSAWRKLPGWIVVASSHLLVFGAFFHLIGAIKIPGIPPLAVMPTAPPAPGSAAAKPPTTADRIPLKRRGVGLPPTAYRAPRRDVPQGPSPAKQDALTVGDDQPSAAPLLSPTQLLKSRGLKKMGLIFVLDEETAILDQMDPLGIAFTELEATYAQLTTAVQNAAMWHQLDTERIAVRTQLNDLNAILPLMPRRGNNVIVDEYNQAVTHQAALRTTLGHYDAELALRAKQLLPPRQMDALSQSFQTQRTAFIESAAPLQSSYERVLRKYEELGLDPAVTGALATLKRTTRGLKLGPSQPFAEGYGQLKTALQQVRPQTEPRRNPPAHKAKTVPSGKRNAPRKSR